MKKNYFILALLMLVLSSCGGIRYQIGESSDAFFKQNHSHSFDMVKSSNEWAVYKWINNWSYTDPPYFFYFRDGALYQVDRGERAPDVIIENR